MVTITTIFWPVAKRSRRLTASLILPRFWAAAICSFTARTAGGKWFNGDKPAFNSEAAQTHLGLLKFSPPGASTGNWSDAVEAFRSGQVALIIESDPLGLYFDDHLVGRPGFPGRSGRA
jgi:hypothetical protein